MKRLINLPFTRCWRIKVKKYHIEGITRKEDDPHVITVRLMRDPKDDDQLAEGIKTLEDFDLEGAFPDPVWSKAIYGREEAMKFAEKLTRFLDEVYYTYNRKICHVEPYKSDTKKLDEWLIWHGLDSEEDLEEKRG